MRVLGSRAIPLFSFITLAACGGRTDSTADPAWKELVGADAGLDGQSEASLWDSGSSPDHAEANAGGNGGTHIGGAAGTSGGSGGGAGVGGMGGTGTGGATSVGGMGGTGTGGASGTGGSGGIPLPTGPVHSIAAGLQHTCALMADGHVRCWGDNSSGQLGAPTWSSAPVDVVGLDSAVTQISAGDSHTCALLDSGGVQCWGRNADGELGNGIVKDAVYPPQNVIDLDSRVTQISAGSQYTCALLDSGRVKCWGDDFFGQLGNGTFSFDGSPNPDWVNGLTSDVFMVSAGSWQTCALIGPGKTKCWGGVSLGEPITGMAGESYSPVDIPRLEEGTSVIASGYDHICALMNTGAVRCWGYNQNGQIGAGTDKMVLNPADVADLGTDVASIGVGGAHTCAVTKSSGLKCWGYNSDGQLGDSTTGDRYHPVDVVGLSSGVSSVSVGFAHTCAVLTNGSVKCWGKNDYGQLGTGTDTNSSIPVDVVGL